MRYLLKIHEWQNMTFVATYTGLTREIKGRRKCFLFHNLRTINGDKISTHLWIPFLPYIEKLYLNKGDEISFEGIVKEYHRIDGSYDYGIENPYYIQVTTRKIKIE